MDDEAFEDIVYDFIEREYQNDVANPDEGE